MKKLWWKSSYADVIGIVLLQSMFMYLTLCTLFWHVPIYLNDYKFYVRSCCMLCWYRFFHLSNKNGNRNNIDLPKVIKILLDRTTLRWVKYLTANKCTNYNIIMKKFNHITIYKQTDSRQTSNRLLD